MKNLLILFVVLFYITNLSAQKTNLVNPLVGTDGHGHTYPGAVAPFGMIQLSPDTRLSGWDGCSGYHYSDSIIYGFSHTHLSGTGCEDLCDILFTPTSYNEKNEYFTLKFSHKDEFASAGYYKVKMNNKYNFLAELTATERNGYHKYLYPFNADTMAIVINMLHRDQTLDWNIEIRNDNTVLGYRASKAWIDNQKIYFAARFSKPILKHYLNEKKGQLYLYFGKPTRKNNSLEAQVAISSVDKQGALNNLNSENLSFQKAKKKSIDSWEKALSKIDIEGGTKEQQRTFYTSLYHCMVSPNLYSDVDGRYRSMINNKLDNGKKENPIAKAQGYNRYTVFSLWDTYRTLNSLLTILEPKRCKDFEKTFLDYYRQTDELPMWELWSWETYCMIGIHGVSVLSEWLQKGISVGEDELALQAMISTANMNNMGINFFNQDGYISSEKEHESVSKTVELAYNMYCIALTAKKLGKKDIYNEYIQKAQYYKNLFNPINTFIQPKENGRFLKDFDPKQIDVNYTEGNGWHYTFYVPQDINTLIDLMGGKNNFEKKLDECFNSAESTTGRQQADVTGLIGQYAHGNEPSQHTAYLYNYAGLPYKTQKLVRQILTTLYSDKPDGVCGNDDCGQMAAWFVMSSLGFYPVSPVSGQYIIGSPLFDKATIHLPNGKNFVIKSKQGKNNPYVKCLKLNGKDYKKTFINHEDIINGGTLEFTMTDKPSLSFGAKEEDCPTAKIKDNLILPVPYLVYDGTGTFEDSLQIKEIYLDKNLNTAKEETSFCTKTQEIKYSYNIDSISSKTVTAKFYKIPKGVKIYLQTKYNTQYTGGGDNALIDQKLGTNNWRLGCWQGYWGDNVDAIIDLGEIKDLDSVGGHFIQDEKSWIYMPTEVQYYISDNGKDWHLFETVQNPIDPHNLGTITNTFYCSKSIRTRYIRMIAKNRKTNPEWHISAGEKSWLFIDEIILK